MLPSSRNVGSKNFFLLAQVHRPRNGEPAEQRVAGPCRPRPGRRHQTVDVDVAAGQPRERRLRRRRRRRRRRFRRCLLRRHLRRQRQPRWDARSEGRAAGDAAGIDAGRDDAGGNDAGRDDAGRNDAGCQRRRRRSGAGRRRQYQDVHSGLVELQLISFFAIYFSGVIIY